MATHMKQYIAKIVRNLAFDLWRTRNSQKRAGERISVALEELSECVPSGSNVEDHFDALELRNLINSFFENNFASGLLYFSVSLFLLGEYKSNFQSLWFIGSQYYADTMPFPQETEDLLEKGGIFGMKKEELFVAIGGVDEALLALCKERPGKRGYLSKLLLIAALIALLTVSATAAVTTYYKSLPINDSQLLPGFRHVMEDYNDYAVILDYELEESMPQELKTAYMPLIPEDWKRIGGTWGPLEGDLIMFSIQWKDPSWIEKDFGEPEDVPCWQDAGWVEFEQKSLGYLDENSQYIDVLADVPEGVEVTGDEQQLGDYWVYVLRTSDFERESGFEYYMPCGETRVYWCDGESMFILRCPAWMEMSQILELMESLYVLDDPRKQLGIP